MHMRSVITFQYDHCFDRPTSQLGTVRGMSVARFQSNKLILW